MTKTITVITLSRARKNLLEKAIQTVRRQTIHDKVCHLILIDDCPETLEFLQRNYAQSKALKWIYSKRGEPVFFCAPRVARLRNLGVSQVQSEWVCYLDDDNQWEENHLESLYHFAAEKNLTAVFSHLQLFFSDGTPFLDQLVPWVDDPEESKKRYAEFKQLGIMSGNSNIVRDVFDPVEKVNGIRSVDMGAWLFKTSLLKKVPFIETYSEEDEREMRTEDDKLNHCLAQMGIETGTTALPTLKYYLGGYSNKIKDKK